MWLKTGASEHAFAIIRLRAESTQPYSDATLRNVDRALWTYPFSKLTDERAKRLFTLCAASLLWCAGLIDDGSIKYLGMQIGASARLVNWVALGLVAYAFAQWFISKQRDQKHWKLSISEVNEPLANELLSPIREVELKVAEHNARHARYAQSLEESLRLRQDVLTRKRQWYRARCVLGNETMRQIAAAAAPKCHERLRSHAATRCRIYPR